MPSVVLRVDREVMADGVIRVCVCVVDADGITVDIFRGTAKKVATLEELMDAGDELCDDLTNGLEEYFKEVDKAEEWVSKVLKDVEALLKAFAERKRQVLERRARYYVDETGVFAERPASRHG